MISDSELLRHCSVPVLNRARSIAFARSERLHDLAYVHEGPLVTLKARVSSVDAETGSCEARITVDERTGCLADARCTCPAGSNGALCKHAAAVALRFNRAPGQFAGFKRRTFEGTSPALADLMRKEDVRRARKSSLASQGSLFEGQESAEPPSASVDLVPTVHVKAAGGWAVSFHISGACASYVLRDVNAFLDAMRTASWESYGSKLAFTHTPAALSDHGRKVFALLARCSAVRDARPLSAPVPSRSGVFGAGTHASPAAALREVPLTEAELAELLAAQGSQAFDLYDETAPAQGTMSAHVEEGDPQLVARVEPFDDGSCIGYLVRREGPEVHLICGDDALYARVTERFYRCSQPLRQTSALLSLIFSGSEEGLFVDEADRDLFCRTVLPLLEGVVELEVPGELEALRPVPCNLEFYLDRQEGKLLCDAVAAYGAKRVPLTGGALGEGQVLDAALPASARDEGAEEMARMLVERYFSVGLEHKDRPTLSARDAEGVAALLSHGLGELRAVGQVLTTPAFDSLVSSRPARAHVGLSVKSGLIELSVLADEIPPSEVSAVLASYRRKRRFHRLRDGTYLDLAQADLSELDAVAADLALTSSQIDAGGASLPLYHAFHLASEVHEGAADESFQAFLEACARPVDPASYQVPAELAGTLRPYQAEGFRWLCAASERGFGGILADEMGLGKSVQLIAYLLAHREEAQLVGPSLVVCPASLVYNWQAEFARFAPHMRVGVVAGAPEERARVRSCAQRPPVAGEEGRQEDYEVLITSYDLLRRDVDAYKELPVFCQVLDEAQYIKNYATKAAQAVRRVPARHRFALTGTPVENRLSELWSIFDFLMPGILGPYRHFQQRWEQPILDGDEQSASELRALVAPFILRRLKSEVLRDLPEKLEGVLYVRLEGEQRKLYAAQERRLRDSVQHTGDAELRAGTLQVLTELMRLRQLCCDPRLVFDDAPEASAKLDAIESLVGTCRDEGVKALVFSQFTSFLELIGRRLTAAGVPYYTITGATPKRRRLELVNAFNADETPVFLISLKAGNTGLNLTGASVVIHADPWWNAAAQNQATDRAHRIGQTRAVSVYQVVAKDTVEERILALQQTKRELAESLLVSGTGAEGIGSLTREDLLALLG